MAKKYAKKYAEFLYSMDGQEATYVVSVDLKDRDAELDYINGVFCNPGACAFELTNVELKDTVTVVHSTRYLKQLTFLNEKSIKSGDVNAVRIY